MAVGDTAITVVGNLTDDPSLTFSQPDAPGCSVCGGPVSRAATGRPRTYCGRACQQRAYRQRSTA